MESPDATEPILSSVMSVSHGQFHRVAYAEWGTDERDIVLCLHGLTRQGRDFDFLARTLRARDRRVICPDLVGRGRSDWLKNPNDYDVNQYVTDMTVLMASLHVAQLDWVGTSLGGLIGMLLAGRENSPIRSLVMNDIGPRVNIDAALRIGNDIRRAPRHFRTIDEAQAYLRNVLTPFGSLTDEHWRHFARHSVKPDPGGGFTPHYDPALTIGFKSPWHYEQDFWKAWDNIKCPVLVLRGATSDVLLTRTASEMAERNARATIVEIPNCGHAPSLTDQEQLRLVSEWLMQPTTPKVAA
jgi:pimeloyl-ACP methyl ester carboxylesterase